MIPLRFFTAFFSIVSSIYAQHYHIFTFYLLRLLPHFLALTSFSKRKITALLGNEAMWACSLEMRHRPSLGDQSASQSLSNTPLLPVCWRNLKAHKTYVYHPVRNLPKGEGFQRRRLLFQVYILEDFLFFQKKAKLS